MIGKMDMDGPVGIKWLVIITHCDLSLTTTTHNESNKLNKKINREEEEEVENKLKKKMLYKERCIKLNCQYIVYGMV